MSSVIKKNTVTLILSLILLLSCLLPVYADDPVQTETDRSITFAGNYTRATLRGGNEAVYLSGGSWVKTGTITIEAESIDMYGENSRYLSCRESVVLRDSEKEITLYSNTLNYDRETELLTVNGWVELIDLKNQMIAKGAYLRIDQENENFLLQVNVSVLKTDEEGNDMFCTADSAYYESEANMLELTGSADVIYNDSHYAASRILIDLETNEFTLEGGVSGKINEKE